MILDLVVSRLLSGKYIWHLEAALLARIIVVGIAGHEPRVKAWSGLQAKGSPCLVQGVLCHCISLYVDSSLCLGIVRLFYFILFFSSAGLALELQQKFVIFRSSGLGFVSFAGPHQQRLNSTPSKMPCVCGNLQNRKNKGAAVLDPT